MLSETSRIGRPFLIHVLLNADLGAAVYDWPDGFAFILSFLAPLWTICTSFLTNRCDCAGEYPLPLQARLTLVFISLKRLRTQQSLCHGPSSGPLALVEFLVGVRFIFLLAPRLDPNFGIAVNVTLAFCMGQDLQAIMDSSFGQPMAQIFFNSFGRKGTLAMWSFIIVAQYMMGSSMVRFAGPFHLAGRELRLG